MGWCGRRQDGGTGDGGGRTATKSRTDTPRLWEPGERARQEAAGGPLHSDGRQGLQRAIRNHKGDVYDPFVGSGTTIIAAEREQRRCYAMEIDPCYVDVTVKRWEDFTGRKAERLTR